MAPQFSRQVEGMPTLQLRDVNSPRLEVSERTLIYSAGVTLSAGPQERSAESCTVHRNIYCMVPARFCGHSSDRVECVHINSSPVFWPEVETYQHYFFKNLEILFLKQKVLLSPSLLAVTTFSLHSPSLRWLMPSCAVV